MPVLPILRYPDPRLREQAEPVEAVDEAVRALARDLLDTLHAAPAVGITAPHVGVLKRLVVIDLGAETGGARVYVNPRVVWASGEAARFTEGSVSMPGVREELERPAQVRVIYHDLDGVEREETAAGFLAACLLHEIDQLDGIFWIDRLSRLKRERLIKRYDKQRRR
jgi:peptide deformylase